MKHDSKFLQCPVTFVPLTVILISLAISAIPPYHRSQAAKAKEAHSGLKHVR